MSERGWPYYMEGTDQRRRKATEERKMTNDVPPNRQSRLGGLFAGSRITLIGAVTGGLFVVAAAIIGLQHADGGSNGSSSSNAGPSAPPRVTQPASSSSGYTMAYSGKDLIINVGLPGQCNSGEGVIIEVPKVDPNEDPYSDAFTLTNNCDGTFQVSPQTGASGSLKVQDSPSGCLNAIQYDPINDQADVSVGNSFCIESAKRFVGYVKVVSLDEQGNVTLRLDGWTAPG